MKRTLALGLLLGLMAASAPLLAASRAKPDPASRVSPSQGGIKPVFPPGLGALPGAIRAPEVPGGVLEAQSIQPSQPEGVVSMGQPPANIQGIPENPKTVPGAKSPREVPTGKLEGLLPALPSGSSGEGQTGNAAQGDQALAASLDRIFDNAWQGPKDPGWPQVDPQGSRGQGKNPGGRHRLGLFKSRAEKGHAYASIPAAAGTALFVGYRYLTEGMPGFLNQALGEVGLYHLNDWLTPLGLSAAGYLLVLALALSRYRKTHPDRRAGDLVRAAAWQLPLFGTLGGLFHEFMQTDLFASLAGFRIPGVFQPGDIAAYLLGGLTSLLFLGLLWKPYSNRRARRISLRTGFALSLVAAAAFVLPRQLAEASLGLALASIFLAASAAAVYLLGAAGSLHEASKRAGL